MRFVDRLDGSDLVDARIGKHDIDHLVIALDLFVKPSDVSSVGDVTSYTDRPMPDLFHGHVQQFLPAPCDVHLRAFDSEQFRRCEADAVATARYYHDFVFETSCHLLIPFLQNGGLLHLSYGGILHLTSKRGKKLSDEHALRADAQKNRERILCAAEELFLEKGAGVSLEEVAKRAGVGIGTLYRRFPTREALLAATSNERFLALAESSRARDPDLTPGELLRTYLEELARNTSIYQSLAASIGTVIQCGTPGCNAITAEGHRLLQRGQDAGTIRRDVTYDDLIYVVTAISIAIDNDPTSKSRLGHLVDLFLNGISKKR